MKRGLIVSALFVGVLSLSGCSAATNSAPTNSPPVNTTSVNKVASNATNSLATTTPSVAGALTQADMRVGNLYLGETQAKIVKDFGTPSGKTTAHGSGSPQWIFQKQGFYINGFPVWEIYASSSFKGSTPRGIHVGSTVAAVKKAYPTLKWNAKLQQFFGATINNEYNIDFMISNGIVHGIVVAKATP